MAAMTFFVVYSKLHSFLNSILYLMSKNVKYSLEDISFFLNTLEVFKSSSIYAENIFKLSLSHLKKSCYGDCQVFCWMPESIL